MFYDLNIPWPVAMPSLPAPISKKTSGKEKKAANTTTTSTAPASIVSQLTPRQRDTLRSLLLDASDLGFSTIAFNFVVKTRFDGAIHRLGSDIPAPLVTLGSRADAHDRIRQLSRMTLVMDDDSLGKHGHGMTATGQTALCGYDLLSAQPHNDAAFSLLCLSMTELKAFSVDIIALDFTAGSRPPYFMKRSLVNAAIANGAVFEVCYAPLVQPQQQPGNSTIDDSLDTTSVAANLARVRRNIIAATRDLFRATNGRGVILSSGAASLLGIRGPYDVINLAAVLGLSATAARDAISSTCRALVLRAETRKTFRGVVADVQVVTTAPAQIKDRPTQKKRKDPEGRDDGSVRTKGKKAKGAGL